MFAVYCQPVFFAAASVFRQANASLLFGGLNWLVEKISIFDTYELTILMKISLANMLQINPHV